MWDQSPSPHPSTSSSAHALDHTLQPKIVPLAASTPMNKKKNIETISATQARNIFTSLLTPQPCTGRQIIPNMANVKVQWISPEEIDTVFPPILKVGSKAIPIPTIETLMPPPP